MATTTAPLVAVAGKSVVVVASKHDTDGEVAHDAGARDDAHDCKKGVC